MENNVRQTRLTLLQSDVHEMLVAVFGEVSDHVGMLVELQQQIDFAVRRTLQKVFQQAFNGHLPSFECAGEHRGTVGPPTFKGTTFSFGWVENL